MFIERKRLKIHLVANLILIFYANTKGAIATTLTQPLDVLKTRAMNAKPGEFKVSICIQIINRVYEIYNLYFTFIFYIESNGTFLIYCQTWATGFL